MHAGVRRMQRPWLLPMNSIPVMNGDFPLVRLACRSFRVALDPLSAPVKKWMNTYITSRVSIWEIYSCECVTNAAAVCHHHKKALHVHQ